MHDMTAPLILCLSPVSSPPYRYSCEMVLVLLERKQTSGDSPYAMVKQAGDSVLGIRTQCFAADKAGVGRNARPPRGRLQYVANIVSGRRTHTVLNSTLAFILFCWKFCWAS